MITQRICLSCKSKEYSLRALVGQSLSLSLSLSAAYAQLYASLMAYNPPLICDSNHVPVLPPYAAQSVYSPVGTGACAEAACKKKMEEDTCFSSLNTLLTKLEEWGPKMSKMSHGHTCRGTASTARHWSATLPMPNRKYVSIRGRNATTPSHPRVQGAGHSIAGND